MGTIIGWGVVALVAVLGLSYVVGQISEMASTGTGLVGLLVLVSLVAIVLDR